MSPITRRGLFSNLFKASPGRSIVQVMEPVGLLERWQPSQDNPWDENAVLHFYGRLGFGVAPQNIQRALSIGPGDLLELAMSDLLVTPEGMPAHPAWWDKWLTEEPYSGNEKVYYQAQEDLYQSGKLDIGIWWIQLMMDPDAFLREKLVYVWANHFTMDRDKLYYPKHAYSYWDCLRRNAWGNLKQMIKEIAIEPAMLLYLNGEESSKDGLNENFAREVMELFLMGRVDRYGKPNYTQEDVRAVASAVCGWRFWIEAPPPDIVHAYFAEYYFDFTQKTTPFGAPAKVYGMLAAKEKGLFTYLDTAIEADIFDTMFEMRGEQISWHIAETIYHAFVSPDSTAASSEQVIDGMAAILRQNDWEMKPMLSALFRSAHFFDLTFRGAVIKSPFEFMLGVASSLDIPFGRSPAGIAAWRGSELGQRLMYSPNVKGWPGDHDWLNSSSLSKRNTIFASQIALGGQVDGGYVNRDNGLGFDPIHWSDDQVRTWATPLEGYLTSASDLVRTISANLLSIPVDDADIGTLLGSVGLATERDWPMLTDLERTQFIRKIVNAILLLPQYQLQ